MEYEGTVRMGRFIVAKAYADDAEVCFNEALHYASQYIEDFEHDSAKSFTFTVKKKDV